MLNFIFCRCNIAPLHLQIWPIIEIVLSNNNDFNGYCMLVFMYAEWSNSHFIIVMIILKLHSTVV